MALDVTRPTGVDRSDTIPTNAVDLDNVSVQYHVGGNALTALSDITVSIPFGAFVSVIGPSGCGKSTMLRLISDLLPTTSGRVSVLGGSPGEARRLRRVGFVFQDAALLPWCTVIDNVSLPLQIGPRQMRRNVRMRPEEALRLVGLESFGAAYPGQLSGGMRQRVSIARALVMAPDILLMDEPFGALDEITRDRMNLELLDLWHRTKMTVIFVTHSIPEAAFLAQRIFVLQSNPGRLSGVVENPLPYPRTRDARGSQQMYEIAARLRQILEGE
ncbi:MAG: ABC transporter ATP-binding protein [Actinomycetes bacterium]